MLELILLYVLPMIALAVCLEEGEHHLQTRMDPSVVPMRGMSDEEYACSNSKK